MNAVAGAGEGPPLPNVLISSPWVGRLSRRPPVDPLDEGLRRHCRRLGLCKRQSIRARFLA